MSFDPEDDDFVLKVLLVGPDNEHGILKYTDKDDSKSSDDGDAGIMMKLDLEGEQISLRIYGLFSVFILSFL